jgi:predicted GNAT superfamily acetyltransferase
MIIRDAMHSDFAQILRLNEESVHFLSPLTPERLDALHNEAAYHRVMEDDGHAVAFLLAFRETADYDSPNFLWFTERYDNFLYVDRIVVALACQGKRIGDRMYDDLFSHARQQCVARVTCEFDIDPPNDASRRFHERRGFSEVGTQAVAGGKKRVSLQAVFLQPEGNAPE